jgi:hypothetical protein
MPEPEITENGNWRRRPAHNRSGMTTGGKDVLAEFAPGEAGGPVAEEGDYAGGVQAWVDFQHRTTLRDALLEMLDGSTKEMRPETAWLRRRVRGLVP